MEESRTERIGNESMGGTKHVRCSIDRAREARLRVFGCAEEWVTNEWKDAEVRR